ncbi:MAG: hypothetical protein RIF41_17340 [Polyangiaceae bacterium]
MTAPFELGWLGGAAETHFRRKRPEALEMPWGTLAASDYAAPLVAAARRAWTQGAFSEYATGAALAALMAALLRAKAPVDLVGMAGDFVSDEMLHTELNARMAMELGGGVPCLADFDAMVPAIETVDPLLAATELAVRICCVSEAVSSPMLAATATAASHPLTRAVLMQIAKDEPPHALLGWLVLEWAEPRLDESARAYLAAAASDQLAGLKQDWPAPPRVASPSAVTDLGWLPTEDYLPLAEDVVVRDVINRLAAYGIALEPSRAGPVA